MMIVVILVGFALLLLLLERLFPLRRHTRALIQRLIVNLGMSMLVFAAAAWVVRPVALYMLERVSAGSYGLLALVPLPTAARFVLAFLLMDLTFYYWHLANHKFPVLWRFHHVHHIDPDLDLSTALRFHVGEVLLSAGFRVLQVGVIGLSPVAYMVYEGVFQACALFHHSNVCLPLQAERWLNTVLVTPRMHGIHHSVVEYETNSNYAVVFSWWDRLHRSLRLNVPQSAIVIGIPAYQDPADNRLWPLLIGPFRRQRAYWRWPDGSRSGRDAAGVQRTCMLA